MSISDELKAIRKHQEFLKQMKIVELKLLKDILFELRKKKEEK